MAQPKKSTIFIISLVTLLTAALLITVYRAASKRSPLEHQTQPPPPQPAPIVADPGVEPLAFPLPPLTVAKAGPPPMEKDQDGAPVPAMMVPVTGKVLLKPNDQPGAGAQVVLALIQDDQPLQVDQAAADDQGVFSLIADRPGTYVLLGRDTHHTSWPHDALKNTFNIDAPPKPKPSQDPPKAPDPANPTPTQITGTTPPPPPQKDETKPASLEAIDNAPAITVKAGDVRILPVARDLELQPVIKVTVQVQDAQHGTPITDYKIRFKPKDQPIAVTNPEGACLFHLPEDTWRLEVDAGDYQLKAGVLTTRGGQDRFLRVNLEPALTLSGVVQHQPPMHLSPTLPPDDVDTPPQEPLPLSGVSVVCRTAAGREFTTQTDVEGQFTLERLPREPGLSLAFFKIGYHTHVIPNLDHQSPPEHLEITMAPPDLTPAVISGMVFDQTGAPMDNVTISVRDASGRLQSTNSRLSGGFLMGGLEFHRTFNPVVTFSKSGYQTFVQEVILEDGAANLSITMAPGISLVGRVTDPKDAPIAGIQIQIRDHERLLETITPQGSGEFLLDRLPSQGLLRFEAEGYSNVEHAVKPEDADSPMTVVLFPLGAISGRVFNEDNDMPVQAFTLFVEPFDEAPDYHLPCSRADGGCQFEDFEGWFRIDGLPKNTPYLLHVEAPGLAPRASYPHLADGNRSSGLKLPISKEGRTLRGHVTDIQGKPRAGVQVNLIGYPLKNNWNRVSTWAAFDSGELKRDAPLFLTTQTDETGAYSFTNLTSGDDLQLMVLGANAARTHRTGVHTLITGRENLFDLTVFNAAQITGRVNMKRFPAAHLMRLFHKESRFTLERSLTGDTVAPFTFDGLPPGSYVLSLQSEDSVVHQETVRVIEGRNQTMEIGFGGIFTVSGVLLFDGHTVPASKVYLGNGRDWRRADAGPDGHFTFDEVGAGAWSVVAFANQGPDPNPELLDRYPNRHQIQLHDNNLDRRFHFQRYGDITGKLPDEAADRIYLTGPERRSAVIEADGSFRFNEIPPGRYHLYTKDPVNSSTRILIPDLEVPAGELGLNLADVIAEPVGSLRIVMGGDIETPDFRYRIALIKPGETDPFRVVHTPSGDAGPFTIQNLPTGPLELKVTATQAGYRVDPQALESEIFENETSDVLLQTEPVTLLQLSVIGNGLPDALVLTNEETELRLKRGVPARSTTYKAVLTTGGKAFIQNITPGVWTLTVRSKAGGEVEDRVVLLPGKPVFKLLYLDR